MENNMKKQIFYFATAVLATGLTACSSDELESEYGVKLADNQLLAIAPSPAETRMDIGQNSSNENTELAPGRCFRRIQRR
jgi:hypothetical protein